MNDPSESGVWVFNGTGANFPAGVFSSIAKAEQWIEKYALSGTLTWYPIDIAVYDWVIANGSWRPTKDHQKEPTFIQRFSSAYTGHYHYENGVSESNAPSETSKSD